LPRKQIYGVYLHYLLHFALALAQSFAASTTGTPQVWANHDGLFQPADVKEPTGAFI
jgi:hypothetical protein